MTATPVAPNGPVRVRPVLALLREPLWWGALLAVLAFSVACLYLGRWQLHRHQAKVVRADRVSANYNAPVAALQTVLGTPQAAVRSADEWRRVELVGRYEPDRTVLVRNRPLDGAYGFEVLVPLRLSSGAALLVDRGWIPFGQNAGSTVRPPVPPAGQVRVTARLRRPEPARRGNPPPGQALRISVPTIAPAVGGPVYRGYGLLADEQPGAATAPTRLPRPDTDLGPHLAYAVQWWAFGLAGYVLLLVHSRREVARRAGGPAETAGTGRPDQPARSARRRPPSRDEQVEDDQVERAIKASVPGPGPAAPPRSAG